MADEPFATQYQPTQPRPRRGRGNTWLLLGALALGAVAFYISPPSKDGPEDLVGLGMLISVLALYFLPTLVAANRKHQQRGPIAILNLFLGWTLVGWVAALVWSATYQPPDTLQLRREWRVK